MNGDGAGVTQFGAFETVVADNDIPDIRMLNYHTRFADRDTFAAIGAFVSQDNISAVIPAINSPLGADLQTFPALRADSGFVNARLRKMCLNFHSGFFGIDFIMMTDGANLQAQAASGALA